MKKVYEGKIIGIIGVVADVAFESHLPALNELLRLPHEGGDVFFEVVSHVEQGVVRCLSLNPTDGLSRGEKVYTTGESVSVPVGDAVLGRVMNAYGEPIDGKGAIRAPRAGVYREPPAFTELSDRKEIFDSSAFS